MLIIIHDYEIQAKIIWSLIFLLYEIFSIHPYRICHYKYISNYFNRPIQSIHQSHTISNFQYLLILEVFDGKIYILGKINCYYYQFCIYNILSKPKNLLNKIYRSHYHYISTLILLHKIQSVNEGPVQEKQFSWQTKQTFDFYKKYKKAGQMPMHHLVVLKGISPFYIFILFNSMVWPNISYMKNLIK